jgi:hypothetical protein
MLRHLVEFHDGRGIEAGHLIQTGQVGLPGSLTDVDEDLLRRQVASRAVVHEHFYGLRIREAPLPHQEIDPLRFLKTPSIGLAEGLDDIPFALSDTGHIDAYRADPDAVIIASSSHMGHPSAGDHRFARGAPLIDARSGYVLSLNDGNVPAGPR